MLTVGFIQENKERVLKSLKIRNYTQLDILDDILSLDKNRKALQQKLEEQLAEGNQLATEIKNLFKNWPWG